MTKKKSSIKRIILFFLVIGIFIGTYFAYYFYNKIYAPNVPAALNNSLLYIPKNSSLEDVADLLDNAQMLVNKPSFVWVAKQMNYTNRTIRSGRFEVKPNMSNHALVSLLRSGLQKPVQLVFNNKRLPEDVAGFVSKHIMADSAEIMAMFRDSAYLAQYGYTTQNFMAAFVPNTYQLFWGTDAQSFFKRMATESGFFWTDGRKAKAKALGLSTIQVMALASIVEKETLQNAEKDRVAGVYLNRLKRNWKLEADPTVVYAWKDFSLKRVLNKHLEIDSPYNTYKYEGLPPGPIAMPSIITIDKTLNAESHDYLFFCAKPNASGFHAFAKTYKGHLVNARRYHRSLRNR